MPDVSKEPFVFLVHLTAANASTTLLRNVTTHPKLRRRVSEALNPPPPRRVCLSTALNDDTSIKTSLRLWTCAVPIRASVRVRIWPGSSDEPLRSAHKTVDHVVINDNLDINSPWRTLNRLTLDGHVYCVQSPSTELLWAGSVLQLGKSSR